MDFRMEMQERIDNGMDEMDAYYETRDAVSFLVDIKNICSNEGIPVCNCTCDPNCECEEREDGEDFMSWYCGT